MKKIFFSILVLIFSLTTFAQRYTGKNEISQQEKLSNEYCTGLFKTSDGTIIDLMDDQNMSVNGYTNVLEWLQGRIAGLQIYYTRNGTAVPFIRNTRASLFLDEIAVDPGFLRMLPVTDIAIIKVIKGPFAGAVGNGGGGTIAIYTIKGDDEDANEMDDGKK
jgi:hypothetical protein